MHKVHITQYAGSISLRVYDTELNKNIGKIDLLHVLDFLENNIKKVSEGKGNTLPIYEIK